MHQYSYIYIVIVILKTLKGKDKKLMIVDLWSNELVKTIEVSKANLLSFKMDPEHSCIHFLSTFFKGNTINIR